MSSELIEAVDDQNRGVGEADSMAGNEWDSVGGELSGRPGKNLTYLSQTSYSRAFRPGGMSRDIATVSIGDMVYLVLHLVGWESIGPAAEAGSSRWEAVLTVVFCGVIAIATRSGRG